MQNTVLEPGFDEKGRRVIEYNGLTFLLPDSHCSANPFGRNTMENWTVIVGIYPEEHCLDAGQVRKHLFESGLFIWWLKLGGRKEAIKTPLVVVSQCDCHVQQTLDKGMYTYKWGFWTREPSGHEVLMGRIDEILKANTAVL